MYAQKSDPKIKLFIPEGVLPIPIANQPGGLDAIDKGIFVIGMSTKQHDLFRLRLNQKVRKKREKHIVTNHITKSSNRCV